MDPQSSPIPTETPPQPVPKRSAVLPILLALLVLLLGSTAFLAYQNIQLRKQLSNPSTSLTPPTTYDECAAAPGSLLQESYPATCVTADGATFTQPLTDEEKKNLVPPGSASCQYKGKTYTSGDTVPSGDTCNSCSCDNGQVACTEMACNP